MFVFQEKYDERFQSLDFRNEELVERYEDCEFISCNFQDSDLSKIEFISCEFKSCNFSLASFLGSKINFCHFDDCKLLSVDFSSISSLRENSFSKCIMSATNFSSLKLPFTKFTGCKLEAAIFETCDISNVDFSSSFLEEAVFLDCNASNADFQTALSYVISPVQNRLAGSKHSKNNLEGLLEEFRIQLF